MPCLSGRSLAFVSLCFAADHFNETQPLVETATSSKCAHLHSWGDRKLSFLFGSVYVTGRFGAQVLSTHVYYHMHWAFWCHVSRRKTRSSFRKQLVPTYLLGLTAGVLLFSSDTLIPISLFVISFFNAGLNQWLTKQYLAAKPEAIERQSLAKYATQSKGSLVHQFLLMTLLFVILRFEHQPLAFLFQLSGTTATNQTSRIQSF